jgi:FAD:protein FMN transferase
MIGLLALMASVAQPPSRAVGPYEFSQVHMGLPVRIVIHAPDEGRARSAAQAAFARIAVLDQMMSDYRPDSELRRLETRVGGAVVVSPELFAVVRRAVDVSHATDGAFDPTVAPLVSLWREARRSGRMPGRESLERARALVGCHHLELDANRSSIRLRAAGVRLDLGGIAKGYILQEALRTLRTQGVTRAMVESGGDIVVGDAPPNREGWTIDVAGADAAFRERASRLTNVALSTSGPTMQFVVIDGVRYSHVIDPRTGIAVTSPTVAYVIAKDAATADALATALTIVGHAGLARIRERFPQLTISLEN